MSTVASESMGSRDQPARRRGSQGQLESNRRSSTGRPGLSTAELLAAARGVRAHAGRPGQRGRAWTPTDRRTMVEVRRRCVDYRRLESLHYIILPLWLAPLCRAQSPSGRSMSRPRWERVLATLAWARQQDELGVSLSYEEGAAWTNCSRRTWARMRAEMEAAGLIEVIPTYEGIDGEHDRERQRNIYRLGPAALRASQGTLDAAPAPRARYAARSVTRQARRRHLESIYRRQRPEIHRRTRSQAGAPPPPYKGSAKEAPQPPRSSGADYRPAPRGGTRTKKTHRSQRPKAAPRSPPTSCGDSLLLRHAPHGPRGPAEDGKSNFRADQADEQLVELIHRAAAAYGFGASKQRELEFVRDGDVPDVEPGGVAGGRVRPPDQLE